MYICWQLAIDKYTILKHICLGIYDTINILQETAQLESFDNDILRRVENDEVSGCES